MAYSFAKVPISVIRNSELSAYSKVLYAEILFRCGKKGFAYGKSSGWADSLGCTVRYFIKLRHELENEGLISVQPNGSGVTIYDLLGVNHSSGGVNHSSGQGGTTVQGGMNHSSPLYNERTITREHNERTIKENDFETFYVAYPRKRAKADAFKAFKAAKNLPNIDSLIKTVEAWKKTEDWTKNDGQFIPYPATWIRKQLWLDEIPEPKTTSAQWALKIWKEAGSEK